MLQTVWYPSPYNEESFARLASLLEGSRWRVSRDPQEKDASVLIDGYPTEEQISSNPGVRAVIIPFAGVPPRTKELLERFPRVTVHNLHHNAAETAEVALALLLAVAKSVPLMDRALRNGDWTPRYDPSLAIRLEGKTAVVIGYGAVGRRIVRMCEGLGMRVIAHRRAPRGDADGIEIRGPEDLGRSLAEADALILAVPQTAETTGMLAARELGLMKPSALLVNVARASLIDEEALYIALKEGRLMAAGLDVWYRYPEKDAAAGYMGYLNVPSNASATFPSRQPFHELANVVMSPHRGGTSCDVEVARIEALAEMLNAGSQGEVLPNRVDLVAGY